MKKYLLSSLFLLLFASTTTSAQSWGVGGKLGGLGTYGNSSDASIGMGAYVRVHPFTFGGVQFDIDYASVESTSYVSFLPSMFFLLSAYEEFHFGFLGGLGFYKESAASYSNSKFGINYGAFAEMALNEQLTMGFQMRGHEVLSSAMNDLWTVMLTLGFKFDSSGW